MGRAEGEGRKLIFALKKAEEEAAKVYEEFVASFSGESNTKMGFVRGETFIPPNSIIPTTPPPPQVPVDNKPTKSGSLPQTLSAFSDSGPEPVCTVN